MQLGKRLLLVTFLESFGTICVERAIYFLTERQFDFSKADNLYLAVAFGLAYVAGALVSHPLAERLGARRVALGCIWMLLGVHMAMALGLGPAGGALSRQAAVGLIYAASVLAGWLHGMKWPVVESFVSAGLTARETFGLVGRFCLAWASAVPLAVAMAGPMIDLHVSTLFAVPALLNAVAIFLLRPLPDRPVHLPHDHPDRPDARSLSAMKTLLSAGRYQLLSSYCLMWILVAVVPNILSGMNQQLSLATPIAALLDVFRVAAFFTLARYHGWHEKRLPLVLAMLLLPAGFAMVLLAGSLEVLIVGEILFGTSAGIIYYASLYYALVVKNASVDAGGAHEGLIGLGFAMGPMAGLIGFYLPVAGSETYGIVVGALPILGLCLVQSARRLIAAGTRRPDR
jgi:hypothetical protein